MCVLPVLLIRINMCEELDPPFVQKVLLFLLILLIFFCSRKKEKRSKNRRQNTSLLHLEYYSFGISFIK